MTRKRLPESLFGPHFFQVGYLLADLLDELPPKPTGPDDLAGKTEVPLIASKKAPKDRKPRVLSDEEGRGEIWGSTTPIEDPDPTKDIELRTCYLLPLDQIVKVTSPEIACFNRFLTGKILRLNFYQPLSAIRSFENAIAKAERLDLKFSLVKMRKARPWWTLPRRMTDDFV